MPLRPGSRDEKVPVTLPSVGQRHLNVPRLAVWPLSPRAAGLVRDDPATADGPDALAGEEVLGAFSVDVFGEAEGGAGLRLAALAGPLTLSCWPT